MNQSALPVTARVRNQRVSLSIANPRNFNFTTLDDELVVKGQTAKNRYFPRPLATRAGDINIKDMELNETFSSESGAFTPFGYTKPYQTLNGFFHDQKVMASNSISRASRYTPQAVVIKTSSRLKK